MLKNYPTLKHILGRAGWYFVTFLVAITINFFLPRLGDANPVDTMMAKASAGLDSASAKEKEEAYLKEFNLVEVDEAGKVKHDAHGKPVRTSLGHQFLNYLEMSLQGDLGGSILQLSLIHI